MSLGRYRDELKSIVPAPPSLNHVEIYKDLQNQLEAEFNQTGYPILFIPYRVAVPPDGVTNGNQGLLAWTTEPSWMSFCHWHDGCLERIGHIHDEYVRQDAVTVLQYAPADTMKKLCEQWPMARLISLTCSSEDFHLCIL
jgi:hypothetical protein